ncbi:MAG: hypothetical protein AAGE03_15965 [Pseudomonadota bacterium]
MTYPIPPHDPRIHVFSVSDGALKLDHQTYLSRLTAPGDGPSLAEAFGAEIDATYAEVFAITDIAPMILRDYLTQAHDIPEPALFTDAAKLDALSGDVVVLAAGAVRGISVLDPRPELTAIGAYAPAQANDTPGDLPKALPGDDPMPEPAPPPPPPGSRRTLIWVILIALAVTLGMVVLL